MVVRGMRWCSCLQATVTIGSETSGSILSPSVINGLVGIKPTVGLVSRYGVVPLSHTQDTLGPMTRSVKGEDTLTPPHSTGTPHGKGSVGWARHRSGVPAVLAWTVPRASWRSLLPCASSSAPDGGPSVRRL